MVSVDFSSRSSKHMNVSFDKNLCAKSRPHIVYLPPKEIISTTESFISLYDDFHIPFEEIYYDLIKLLLRPLKRSPNTDEQNLVIKYIESVTTGKVIQRDKKFFLSTLDSGDIEMGLVSESFRRLSTISYLISSGSLDEKSILFWDEPESGMGQKLVPVVAEIITALAKMGVQVFVATHDDRITKELNRTNIQHNANIFNPKLQIISLFKGENGSISFNSTNEFNNSIQG